jgi:hypothetical protein
MLQREALRPRLRAPVQFALALAVLVGVAAIAAPISVPTPVDGYINGSLRPRPASLPTRYRDLAIYDGAAHPVLTISDERNELRFYPANYADTASLTSGFYVNTGVNTLPVTGGL